MDDRTTEAYAAMGKECLGAGLLQDALGAYAMAGTEPSPEEIAGCVEALLERNGFDLTKMQANGDMAVAVVAARRAGPAALFDMVRGRMERRLREGGVNPTPADFRRLLTDIGDEFAKGAAADSKNRVLAQVGLKVAQTCYSLALVQDLRCCGTQLTRLGFKEEGLDLFKKSLDLLPS